jgi:hypothetical protein
VSVAVLKIQLFYSNSYDRSQLLHLSGDALAVLVRIIETVRGLVAAQLKQKEKWQKQ